MYDCPSEQTCLTHSPLWDLFCLTSIVGIWPRFIEPKLILTTKIDLRIANLPSSLDGIKILQISDIHFNQSFSNLFIKRLIKKIKALRPNLIVLTGDFLCYAQLLEENRLKAFLNRLEAPYGCYAVLGNHDYASCVSINQKGDYDIIAPSSSSLSRAFVRLKHSITLTKTVTDRAKNVPLNSEFMSLISETPVQLLHNATTTISVKNSRLNICGLGEHALGRVDAKAAFKNYDKDYPGIILLHNPDAVPQLKDYPGEVVLSGHAHGGQVNLPWIWKKFTLLENMQFKKGLIQVGDKWLYVNRGIGSILPFRWFSPPEILLLTLCRTKT